MNKTEPCETPSTSLKRELPEDDDKNTTKNDDSLPKKTRKSATKSSVTKTISKIKNTKRSPTCVVDKWTLEHKGPGPGLIELMPDTGIYVNEEQLSRRKSFAHSTKKLIKLLLPLIFSSKAIMQCAYPGVEPKKKRKYQRLGLDEYARNTLMAFVTNHAKESDLEILSPEEMNSIMTRRLSEIRKNVESIHPDSYRIHVII